MAGTRLGKLMVHALEVRPTNPLWTPYGPHMDPLWTPYGPPMDPYVLPMAPLWSPYGLPMDPLWARRCYYSLGL